MHLCILLTFFGTEEINLPFWKFKSCVPTYFETAASAEFSLDQNCSYIGTRYVITTAETERNETLNAIPFSRRQQYSGKNRRRHFGKFCLKGDIFIFLVGK